MQTKKLQFSLLTFLGGISVIALGLGWRQDHVRQAEELNRAQVMITALREAAESPEESLMLTTPRQFRYDTAQQFIADHFQEDLETGGDWTSFWPALQSVKNSPIAREAVDPLLRLVDSSNAEVRNRAVTSLGELGVGSQEVVAALAKSLQDSEPVVRRHAADALGKLGPKAADAIPALADALESHKSAAMQSSVAKAMWEVSEDPRAVQATNALLFDEDGAARGYALDVLSTIGPAAGEDAVAQVISLLEDKDGGTQEQAILVLSTIASPTQARDALLEVFPRLQGRSRRLAATSLSRLEKQLARNR